MRSMHYRMVVSGAFVFALALPCAAAGQQAMPSNYDHLKHLENRVGTWTGEMEFFGTPMKGRKGKMEATVEWAMNKNFQRMGVRVNSGPVTLVSEAITGWDASTKQVKTWTFASDRSISETVLVETDSDGRLLWEGTILIPNGEKLDIRDVVEPSKDSVNIKRYAGDRLLWVATARRKEK